VVSAVFEFKAVGYIFWLMKRVGQIAIYLASGLALNASSQAGDALLPNNPYTAIVAHNMFGLNPAQAAGATDDANPPPKITPNGIMTIFGTRQALFTVDGASKSGQSGKGGSYILSEGQRQDDIEVTHIDEKSGIVTFNNHGVVQEIPLIKAPAVATSAVSPTPIAANSSRPVAPFNNFNNNGGVNSSRLGDRSGRNENNSFMGTDGNSNLRAIPTRGITSTLPSQNTLTPEAQAAAIIIQTQKYKDEGNPAYPIMPPIPGFSPPPAPNDSQQ
jgi:hypothetical protein